MTTLTIAAALIGIAVLIYTINRAGVIEDRKFQELLEYYEWRERLDCEYAQELETDAKAREARSKENDDV
jgi:hypothetical protein